uniref:RPN1 N-terminal domain-containing protein n=1 Tax=Timema monikensis TaxID=170555 RepID=A0A7R9E056_9NEOP|nr:unnamed protein product [Timema monikensis]
MKFPVGCLSRGRIGGYSPPLGLASNRGLFDPEALGHPSGQGTGGEKDEKLYHPALECLRDLIRTSTTSMTSVPKPLKYLRNHYNTIKEVYLRMRDPEVQKFCADIISVLAMTQLNEIDQAVERDCLKYCLLGTKSDVGDWGHEYVRQLESEIAEEWILITKERNVATKAQLLSIVDMIVSFDMSHNAEIQACDLLMEIDEIDRLRDYIDTSNYSRVCLYLISCALYVDKPEYIKIINLVLDFFLKFREYTRAMCLAMNLNDCKLMTRIFESCQDERNQEGRFRGMISPSKDLNKASQAHNRSDMYSFELLNPDGPAGVPKRDQSQSRFLGIPQIIRHQAPSGRRHRSTCLGSQGKVNRDFTWTGSPPGSKSPCDDDDVLTVAARRSQIDPVAPSQRGLHCPDIVMDNSASGIRGHDFTWDST